MSAPQELADTFTRYRPLLFSIAYEMLGSVVDAEDVLQESYLRWAEADRGEISNDKAYLAQIVTRLSLNQLRTAQRRRETYIGPWLPEPIRTQADASADVILAEALSFAMLTVLEALSPTERAVFVLREVFEYPHSEIAAILEKSDIAVRQVARRARERVAERKRRFDAQTETAQALLSEFVQFTASGEVDKLVTLLTDDAKLFSDGGGIVHAARRPIEGSDNVARFMVGIARKGGSTATAEFGEFNAQPAVLIFQQGTLSGVVTAEVLEGRICSLYIVVNPEKLRRAQQEFELARG